MSIRPRRYFFYLLALCLMATTVGTLYTDCTMPMAPAQSLAKMDCHQDATAKTNTQKSCCTDQTCLKCFPSTFNVTSDNHLPAALKITTITTLLTQPSPITPEQNERPPKIA